MKFIISKIRGSLLLRLLSSYLFLATVPIILIGSILIHTTRATIERHILAGNMELASKSAEIIEGTLDRARDILKLNAQNPAIYRMDFIAQELVINNIVSEFNIFRKISILDTMRNIITSTSYSREQSPQEIAFIQSLVPGGITTSAVFISNDQLPYLLIAHQIIYQNEFVGYIIGDVKLQAMWELVDRCVKSEKSQAFIFDSQSRFLAHTDRRKVFLNEVFTEQEIIAELRKHQDKALLSIDDSLRLSYDNRHSISGEGELQTFAEVTEPILENPTFTGKKVYNDASGEKMIAAYSSFRSKQWGLVIQQPASEAFAPARRMQIQILIFVIAAVLVGSLFAYVYTMHIVQPLNVLMDGIEKFSTGYLKHRIVPLSEDEIGQLSIKFNEMADKLLKIQRRLRRTERLATLSRMASTLSHEIRNPLNSMVINMQILKREFDKNSGHNLAKLNKYYQIIVSEIDRIDDLVKNFLLISKPKKLSKNQEYLDDIIKEIVTSQKARAEQLKVQIITQISEKKIQANVDRERLHQAFLNIFLNAFDAMPNGGKLVVNLKKIKRRDEKSEMTTEMARILFIDSGCGIPEEQIDNIFDFYYSSKPDGTGIGLALVQQIIEDHDGRIRVKSKVGKGTVFNIIIPI